MTTTLITGPTRGLGRSTTLALAGRGSDLVLVGRHLSGIAAEARSRGVTVHEVPADLSRLADVRAAAAAVRHHRLDAVIANAGLMSADTTRASADGYELTFAVNYLAHAQLIGDLLGSLATPARIVLLGSNTYHENVWRRLLQVPPADWRDPLELARPGNGTTPGAAYSNAKLALLYYAHELQRHVGTDVNVAVFEPGWMPGTALGRDAPAAAQAVMRGISRIPGVSTPEKSGPLLAAVALDPRWAGLRDGAFVLKDTVTEVKPVAQDPARERRLWEATAELLGRDQHRLA
jgi:NAD(P)-dependent dehydrogenase (short-subunit alcohol dehydrogenase family)